MVRLIEIASPGFSGVASNKTPSIRIFAEVARYRSARMPSPKDHINPGFHRIDFYSHGAMASTRKLVPSLFA